MLYVTKNNIFSLESYIYLKLSDELKLSGRFPNYGDFYYYRIGISCVL